MGSSDHRERHIARAFIEKDRARARAFIEEDIELGRSPETTRTVARAV